MDVPTAIALKVYYVRDGEEIELQACVKIEGDGSIMLKNVLHERQYKLGDRVTFDVNEFGSIAFGCWIFTGDLGSKLPGIGKPAEAVETGA